MNIKAAFPALLMAGALAGAPVAYAATDASGAKQPPRMTHYITYSDQVSAQDIAAFKPGDLSLAQAIRAAEKKTGDKAVEAVFKATPDRPHYVVWMMQPKDVLATWVDAKTGEVTALAPGDPLNRLNPRERAAFMATDAAKMNLADAAALAQKNSGDRPIAANLVRFDRTTGYQIAMVHQGALQTVWVPPNNPALVAAK